MPSSLRLDKQLQDASRLGSLVDVDAALAYGADPNHRDDSGYTPLFYAAQGNSPDCIRRLVAHGADVNAPTGSALPPPAKWHRDIGRSDIADVIQAFAATHAARARLADAPPPVSRPRPRA